MALARTKPPKLKPRLPILADDQLDESAKAIIKDWPYALHRVLANSPETLPKWMTFALHILRGNTLPAWDREIAILRVAWNCRSNYEWGMHERLARSIGFTDALSDETLPAVTDVDTPATGNGATDVAVVHLDTDQTLTTAAFVSESTGSAFACQKVNLGTWTPTAATYYTVRVQLATNNAFCKVFDSSDPRRPILVANGEKGLTSALEGGTAVRPHMLFGTRNTSAKVVDIDLIRVWQDR